MWQIKMLQNKWITPIAGIVILGAAAIVYSTMQHLVIVSSLLLKLAVLRFLRYFS